HTVLETPWQNTPSIVAEFIDQYGMDSRVDFVSDFRVSQPLHARIPVQKTIFEGYPFQKVSTEGENGNCDCQNERYEVGDTRSWGAGRLTCSLYRITGRGNSIG